MAAPQYVRSWNGAPPVDNRIVTFSKDAIQDEQATMQAGRPIYRDVEMVEIRFPGNQLNIWSGRVTDEHREMYAREYEAFMKGEEQSYEGTPIEQLTILSRAQVKELKFLDIHTIEHAAGINDQIIQRMGMGARKLRELAQKYLDNAQGFSPIAALVSAKEDLEGKVAMQAAQIDELNRMMVGMQAQLTNYASSPQPVREVHSGMVDHTNLGASVPTAPSSLDSIGDEQPRQKRAYTKRKAA